ncbi:peptidyl-tRNA hydrolase, partial [Ramicandelaber brevisporus]
KMVLVVRTDIGMTKGKVAAQCSHATLGAYKMALKETPTLLAKWERQGQAKVALKGEGGEDGILTLQAQAVSMGLAARSIVDAGRTQLAPNTRTVLAIGPGPAAAIDTITGHLKL